jgi:hypothetical protein
MKNSLTAGWIFNEICYWRNIKKLPRHIICHLHQTIVTENVEEEFDTFLLASLKYLLRDENVKKKNL